MIWTSRSHQVAARGKSENATKNSSKIYSNKDSTTIHLITLRNDKKFKNYSVNPQAPVAQKIADEVVFRRFQGEGVAFFFKSYLNDPLSPQIFVAHLLENTDLSPSRFHFQWVLYQDHVLSQMV